VEEGGGLIQPYDGVKMKENKTNTDAVQKWLQRGKYHRLVTYALRRVADDFPKTCSALFYLYRMLGDCDGVIYSSILLQVWKRRKRFCCDCPR